MKMIEFEASQFQLDIIYKLNHGIWEKKLDQAFVNDMLKELVRVVGVPIEPSEISKALASISTTCERSAIEAWFDDGNRANPKTKEVVEETGLT